MYTFIEVVSCIVICLSAAMIMLIGYRLVGSEVMYKNIRKVQYAVYWYKRTCLEEKRLDDYKKVEFEDIQSYRLLSMPLNPAKWKCSTYIDAEKYELIKPYLEKGDPNE